MRRTPLTPLALVLACACTSRAIERTPEPVPAVVSAPREIAPSAPEQRRELPVERTPVPATWRTTPLADLERDLARAFAAPAPVHYDAASLDELAQAVEGGGEAGVRAVLLLAATRDETAGDRLLQALEQRTADVTTRATLVVAAASFVSAARAPRAVDRLESLAIGQRPHPDLAVRVECARSVVALGRPRAISFLLDVLRRGTRFAQAGAPPVDADLEWLQTKAAVTLSHAAGIALRYRVELPLAQREEEVQRLEALLLSRAAASATRTR